MAVELFEDLFSIFCNLNLLYVLLIRRRTDELKMTIEPDNIKRYFCVFEHTYAATLFGQLSRVCFKRRPLLLYLLHACTRTRVAPIVLEYLLA